MHIFLSAFDDIPDPRAENARHDLGELLVIAFVSVCGFQNYRTAISLNPGQPFQ
jgi:hypothetical protein